MSSLTDVNEMTEDVRRKSGALLCSHYCSLENITHRTNQSDNNAEVLKTNILQSGLVSV